MLKPAWSMDVPQALPRPFLIYSTNHPTTTSPERRPITIVSYHLPIDRTG